MRLHLLVLSLLCALVALPAVASADATSDVTSPADGAIFATGIQAGGEVTFTGTVAGSTVPSTVDIGCFREGTYRQPFVRGVPVTDGAFSTTVKAYDIGSPGSLESIIDAWCDVRALPSGSTNFSDGDTSGDPIPAGSTGPRLFFGYARDDQSPDGAVDFWRHLVANRQVSFNVGSLGTGIYDSFGWGPDLAVRRLLFGGAAVWEPAAGGGIALVVDGVRSYPPSGAYYRDWPVIARAGTPTLGGLAFTADGFKASTAEIDPLVRCQPSEAACDAFSTSGVQVARTMDAGPLVGAAFDDTAARLIVPDR